MAYITRSRSRYCSEAPLAFPWTEVSKAEQKATVGQAVPEIPLSVGSKPELCKISVYFPVHSRICPRMHTAIVHCYYTQSLCTRRGFCTSVPSLSL